MRTTLILILALFTLQAYAQPVEKVDTDHDGICNKDGVKHLASYMPQFNGSKTELEKELNSLMAYTKEDKKVSGDVVVRLIINCKGEPIVSRVMNAPNNSFNVRVLEAFKKSEVLKNWTAAKHNDKNIDCIFNVFIIVKKGTADKLEIRAI